MKPKIFYYLLIITVVLIILVGSIINAWQSGKEFISIVRMVAGTVNLDFIETELQSDYDKADNIISELRGIEDYRQALR